jgi:hypothetical protein
MTREAAFVFYGNRATKSGKQSGRRLARLLAVGAAQAGTKFLRVVVKMGEEVAPFFFAAFIFGADIGVSGDELRSNF